MKQTKTAIESIKLVVSGWEKIASKYKISKMERDMMNSAFRY